MEVVGQGIGKKTQFPFVTFSFHDFVPVQNFKAISSATPTLLNLNQDQPSKMCPCFCSNWGYDNYSHRNVGITKLCSDDPIYNMILATW